MRISCPHQFFNYTLFYCLGFRRQPFRVTSHLAVGTKVRLLANCLVPVGAKRRLTLFYCPVLGVRYSGHKSFRLYDKKHRISGLSYAYRI